MKFNEKLQKLRKEHQMSQEDLAYTLGVSRQAVSKWESGNGYPETEKIIQLAQMFKVSVDYLLNEETIDVGEVKEAGTQEEKEVYDMEKISYILSFKRKFALAVAAGVSMIIAGTTIPVWQDSDMAAAFFILIVAAAVSIFIVAGMLDSHKLDLDKKQYRIASADLIQIKQLYNKFHIKSIIAITSGVFLCIGGIVVPILLGMDDQSIDYSGLIFLYFIAAAVFLFIFFGVMETTYEELLHYEEHNRKVRREQLKEKKINWIYGITMPLAAMWFLYYNTAFSGMDGIKEAVRGNRSWLVFPIVAFLTYAVTEIYSKLRLKEEDQL